MGKRLEPPITVDSWYDGGFRLESVETSLDELVGGASCGGRGFVAGGASYKVPGANVKLTDLRERIAQAGKGMEKRLEERVPQFIHVKRATYYAMAAVQLVKEDLEGVMARRKAEMKAEVKDDLKDGARRMLEKALHAVRSNAEAAAAELVTEDLYLVKAEFEDVEHGVQLRAAGALESLELTSRNALRSARSKADAIAEQVNVLMNEDLEDLERGVQLRAAGFLDETAPKLPQVPQAWTSAWRAHSDELSDKLCDSIHLLSVAAGYSVALANELLTLMLVAISQVAELYASIETQPKGGGAVEHVDERGGFGAELLDAPVSEEVEDELDRLDELIIEEEVPDEHLHAHALALRLEEEAKAAWLAKLEAPSWGQPKE
jgi:hypothetical protein